MKFARTVFLVGGIWGLLVVTPLYFRADPMGRDAPAALTHPEFYYGFLDVTLAWQFAFLLIAADPARLRLLMPVAMFEKFSYVATIGVLLARGRIGIGEMTLGALADLVLGILFAAAFVSTRDAVTRRI